MKTTIFLVIIIGAILITGCTKFADEKKLIEDKLQSFQGTQIDLNIKFNEFEHIKTITYLDSLKYLLPIYSKNLKIKAGNFDEFKIESDSLNVYNTLMIDSLSVLINELEKLKENYKKRWERNYNIKDLKKESETQSRIYAIEAQRRNLKQDTEDIQAYQNILRKYNSVRSTVIGTIYKVNYTAFNPLLNTNQTIDTYYLINKNKSYIQRLRDYNS